MVEVSEVEEEQTEALEDVFRFFAFLALLLLPSSSVIICRILFLTTSIVLHDRFNIWTPCSIIGCPGLPANGTRAFEPAHHRSFDDVKEGTTIGSSAFFGGKIKNRGSLSFWESCEEDDTDELNSIESNTRMVGIKLPFLGHSSTKKRDSLFFLSYTRIFKTIFGHPS